MNDSRLAYLFQAYFNKTASSNERDELMILLEKAENDDHVKALLSQVWEQTDLNNEVFSNNDGEEMLARILQAQKSEETIPVVPIRKNFTCWLKNAVYNLICNPSSSDNVYLERHTSNHNYTL